MVKLRTYTRLTARCICTGMLSHEGKSAPVSVDSRLLRRVYFSERSENIGNKNPTSSMCAEREQQ
jgi:hypothetical protein